MIWCTCRRFGQCWGRERGFDKIGGGKVRGGSSNWKSEILDYNMLKSKINIAAVQNVNFIYGTATFTNANMAVLKLPQHYIEYCGGSQQPPHKKTVVISPSFCSASIKFTFDLWYRNPSRIVLSKSARLM